MLLDASRSRTSGQISALRWLLDCRVIVHPLLFCPPLPKGSRYCLVVRDALGAREVVGSGLAMNTHQPQNLAVVRQRGANLGANEVFVLEPAVTDGMRGRIAAAAV
jgi:hypothetical protein